MSSTSSRSGCVRIDQPLDVAEVDRVRTAGLAAVVEDAVGARQGVVLDLSHCDFVDAVGHRMLADLTRSAERWGLELRLVGASARVARLIRLLDAVLSGDVGAQLTTRAAPGTSAAGSTARDASRRQLHPAGDRAFVR